MYLLTINVQSQVFMKAIMDLRQIYNNETSGRGQMPGDIVLVPFILPFLACVENFVCVCVCANTYQTTQHIEILGSTQQSNYTTRRNIRKHTAINKKDKKDVPKSPLYHSLTLCTEVDLICTENVMYRNGYFLY